MHMHGLRQQLGSGRPWFLHLTKRPVRGAVSIQRWGIFRLGGHGGMPQRWG